MAAATDRRLGVVIVTYNSASVLGACLDALTRSDPQPRCVVVDGASADESVAIAEAHRAVDTVIHLGGNLGYAAGINAGASTLGADSDLVVLNPDCRVRPDTLERLVAAAEATGAGIVAPRILEADGSLHHSLHRTPTVVRAWANALIGPSLASRVDVLAGEERRGERYDRRHVADWASGAILLVTAACRRAVGDWDESFFLYSEETDYQLRAHDKGFDVVYEPAAVCVHDVGDSRTSPFLWSILRVNSVRSYAKRHGPISTMAFRTAVLAGEGMRAAMGKAKNRAAFGAVLRDRRPDETPTEVAPCAA